jgi:transcriptional regulator with XRE-family HTH domain
LIRLGNLEQDSISSLETGKREAHPGTIRKLAKALDVEPTELIKEH